jgi:hypothetical protein
MRGRVICEAKRIRSHLLLLRLGERLPSLIPSICAKTGTLLPIDATMQICRTGCRAPLQHLPLLVLVLARLWRAGRFIGFFNNLLERRRTPDTARPCFGDYPKQ